MYSFFINEMIDKKVNKILSKSRIYYEFKCLLFILECFYNSTFIYNICTLFPTTFYMDLYCHYCGNTWRNILNEIDLDR